MQMLSSLAAETAEHGKLFLGEDAIGWRTALLAAFMAAVAYELMMAVTRKVSLRIPFLVLRAGRLFMSKEAWQLEFTEWEGELWSILHGKGIWLTRFVHGLWWAVSVVVGARQTARADARVSGQRSDTEERNRAWLSTAASVVSLINTFRSAPMYATALGLAGSYAVSRGMDLVSSRLKRKRKD